jgi:hypothetical protein
LRIDCAVAVAAARPASRARFPAGLRFPRFLSRPRAGPARFRALALPPPVQLPPPRLQFPSRAGFPAQLPRRPAILPRTRSERDASPAGSAPHDELDLGQHMDAQGQALLQMSTHGACTGTGSAVAYPSQRIRNRSRKEQRTTNRCSHHVPANKGRGFSWPGCSRASLLGSKHSTYVLALVTHRNPMCLYLNQRRTELGTEE